MARLILVRHGESIWNLENRFTGWIDVSLSQKGVEQAREAGDKLSNENFKVLFTSHLIRAQMTLFEILNKNNKNKGVIREHDRVNESSRYHHGYENNGDYTSLYYLEELNERFYGDLQGKNKEETTKEHGEEQVKLWRRSYDIAPPGGDSLKDTGEYSIPCYTSVIKPSLSQGTVLVVAHGNSLRSIIKEIEGLDKDEILDVEIGTGVPIIYELDDNNFSIISKNVL